MKAAERNIKKPGYICLSTQGEYRVFRDRGLENPFTRVPLTASGREWITLKLSFDSPLIQDRWFKDRRLNSMPRPIVGRFTEVEATVSLPKNTGREGFPTGQRTISRYSVEGQPV